MQRGIMACAITGMMAISQSGFAADPAMDQPVGKTSVGSVRVSSAGAANRNGKKPAAKPSKNYYQDLFADEDAGTATTTRRTASAHPAPANSAPANPVSAKLTTPDWDEDLSVGSTGKAAESAKRKSPLSFDDENDAFAESPKFNEQVTQAEYDKVPGKRQPILQTRSDGRPRSAPPVNGREEPLDKASRKIVTKETAARTAAERTAPVAPSAAVMALAAAGAQTPQVTVEWVKHGEFNVGQECLVDLVVRNNGEAVVSQIAVDGIFPATVRLTEAKPEPNGVASDRLTWVFDQMVPASERRITLKLVPNQRGEIGAVAQVRFTGVSAAAFMVSEPLLKISLKAPSKEIMIGDPASQMITVTNPGTGTAQDVKIEAKLSEGLEHPAREDRLIIEVGAVGPGETRTYRLPLTAAQGGPQSVSVVATSSSDASSTDAVEFNVIAPSLKIAVDGPALRYKGRNAKYLLTITNDGSIVNNNVHVSQMVAEGFKFISADHGGKFDSSVNSIHWMVGRLEPGESTQVICELQAHQLGEFAHSVQVTSDTGVQADARIETRVDGIASLTMELVDLDDPVETGSETGYEIRVKNDGSKVASNVSVACELPAGMEFLSSKSTQQESLEGRQLTFSPVEQIAPGGQTTFRIVMKVQREGSHRMRVRLSGGGLQEAVVLEEVTRAYSDGSK